MTRARCCCCGARKTARSPRPPERRWPPPWSGRRRGPSPAPATTSRRTPVPRSASGSPSGSPRGGPEVLKGLPHALRALDALGPGDVAPGGGADRLRRALVHVPVPPAAVDPVERQRRQGPGDAGHLRGGQRDEVRVAAHEGDVAAVAHHRDRVPDQQRAPAAGAGGPVKDRRAREVPAALHQRHPGDDVEAVVPQPDRRVGSRDPARVGTWQVDGRATERLAPLDDAAVEVRVGCGDAGEPAQFAHALDSLLVKVAWTVPEDVAVLGLDQERPLADGKGRGRADAGEPGLQVPDLRPEPLVAELVKGRPALALPADVLALVLADPAAGRWRLAGGVLDPTGSADEACHVRRPFSPAPVVRAAMVAVDVVRSPWVTGRMTSGLTALDVS